MKFNNTSKKTPRVLALGIFAGLTTQQQIQKKIMNEFQASEEDVKKYHYMIVYTDYGSYEGTGWMLMKEKQSGKLFDNHSSHCSCFGNEGQFTPEPTNLPYLKSKQFNPSTYGGEDQAIKKYLAKLK
jgi:hypothetical protein